MLCGPCNKALGLLDDDPLRILRAHLYVLGENPLGVGPYATSFVSKPGFVSGEVV
jgi:hypothetical protein